MQLEGKVLKKVKLILLEENSPLRIELLSEWTNGWLTRLPRLTRIERLDEQRLLEGLIGLNSKAKKSALRRRIR